jgi:hypothetical protein
MIISCENCNKKFELEDNLMPSTGRLLQCGACSYKWHYTPVLEKQSPNDEVEKAIKIKQKEKKIKKKVEVSIETSKPIIRENISNNKPENKVKKVSYFNYLLVLLITFVAIIILIDTFQNQLLNFLPEINLYLDSLYETLKDIYLFFKDLF